MKDGMASARSGIEMRQDLYIVGKGLWFCIGESN